MQQRLISLKEVLDRIPLSKATIYRRIKAGTFPQPIRLSAHRIAFSEQEINAWIARHVEARTEQEQVK